MSSHEQLAERDREMIPTMLVRAMGVLVLICLAIVSYASFTDRPLEALPPDLEVVKERVLVIEAEMTGAVRVTSPDGTLIAELAPEQGGFIAGVGRVLERERGKQGLEGSLPIRLIQYEDGRLALRDDHTDWRAELRGFGQTNEAAFYNLLNN